MEKHALWLYAFLGGAASLVTAATTSQVTVGHEPQALEWQHIAIVALFGALFGLMLGWALRGPLQRRQGDAVIVVVASALATLVVATLTQRWIASVRFEPLVFWVTATLWKAIVRDIVTGAFFIFLIGPFTVVIDLLWMIVTAVAAALLPFAVMTMAPTLGAFGGALCGMIVVAVVRRIRRAR